ncbi:hypothetical protein KOW79_013903 [Hemibagrus wyckioides]|uniref:Chemokine interleukin-8-like domain-containing protein n=1 Tax=Hemibagrus wyckioides TaxID=337641 RepID=A0A9D3NHS8_9TELE|nr:hypothetical protein KOW79_013903 [Hemibagrus wyckioides]
MDFKILLLVLCITFTSVQGAIPPCCIATAPIRPRMLGRMDDFTIQNSYGRCEIDAVVVKIREKRYCAPMQQRALVERIKQKRLRNNYMYQSS